MSPWSWVTPGSGAMACRSTATIFTSSRSSSGRCGHNIIISTLYYITFVSNFSCFSYSKVNVIQKSWRANNFLMRDRITQDAFNCKAVKNIKGNN